MSEHGEAVSFKTLRKEMPDEVVPGLQWMVPQILKDLSQAKMWPVKLAHLKHQDKLRP